MQFDKPPLTTTEQIDLLVKRGLLIPDREQASHYLRHLNYYRLGAYWLPFEIDHVSHRFTPGTRFDDVLNLYIFDREFRLLLLDAIERIEVSIRAAWAYEMAHRHGPHCQLNQKLFRERWNYDRHYSSVRKEVSRSNEAFILHIAEKYDEDLPPIWVMVEVMTFGQLSNWYGNTRHRQDRNAVAEGYELDERILTSLLHHLTIVRNTCAHHARLWNREFAVIPTLPKQSDLPFHKNDCRKIYNTLVFALHLMNQISPGHHWKRRLIELFSHHDIETDAMGFPNGWESHALWA